MRMSTIIIFFLLLKQTICLSFVIRKGEKLHYDVRMNMVADQSNNLHNDIEIRAGRDGYSLARKPLSHWDSSADPFFPAPPKIFEGSKNNNGERGNSEWWALKQNHKETPSYSSLLPVSPVSNEAKFSSLSRKSPEEQRLDLIQRSSDTLDFPTILGALQRHCMTTPAKIVVAEAAVQSQRQKINKLVDDGIKDFSLTAKSSEEARQSYKVVNEMLNLIDTDTTSTSLSGAYFKNRRGVEVTIGRGNPLPLRGLTFDIESILKMISDDGEVLQGPEILEISLMMETFEDLLLWSRALERIVNDSNSSKTRINQRNEHFDSPHLFVEIPRIVQSINLNSTLQDLLEEAFDEDGRLSGEKFSYLGQLRTKLRNLKEDILQTLNDIIQLPSLQSKLALESGGPIISEVESSTGAGRLVIPIDPKHSSTVGIVHDSSRSGKTMYVEPREIVEPTNNLRLLERDLEIEESRIWKLLTEQVWINSKGLRQSVKAVTKLDLSLARCRLGQDLNGVIPDVQDHGLIHLKNARHPVLLLRKIETVVGSDILLGDDTKGLILTGPNSGGKTVILKMIGILSLLSKSGIPIPCDSDSNGSYRPRFDFFNPVLADIGDIQSVDSDLSTFSGHMLVCREVLENVRSENKALVLMDELGSGTDPNQGVAIAQAVLEALLHKGCRVVITTHYMALKQLASSDDRFSVAGMQFIRGCPTYKLLPGVVGESYAIAVAERLKMPKEIVDRANELLDSETRQMGDLIQDLEDQKFLIEEQMLEIEEKKKEMQRLEYEMKEKEIRLENKLLTARRSEAKKFAKKLQEKEQILEEILVKLKSDPSRKIVTRSWSDIRYMKRDAIEQAENVPSVLQAKKAKAKVMKESMLELVPLAAEIRNRQLLTEGESLKVCKTGPFFGKEVTVVKDKGKQIEVNVSGTGISLTMKHTDLSRVLKVDDESKPKSMKNQKSPRLLKAVDKALENEFKSNGNELMKSENKPKSLGLRIAANTVDVRGCNFFNAQERITSKISYCHLNGHKSMYILHGHGSGGVLKSKLREWIKKEKRLIKSWTPAAPSDGGDAFTRVEV